MENIKLTFNDADNMHMHVPITKVDKEKRTVSGFATLNNLDKHGDVVDADASAKAFKRFRGNIREMHMPIAVGKMVSFTEKEYTDENGQTFKGIYVTARISKGAQDTWEKVLDGTLNGFSIGAAIVEKADGEGEDGERFRIIKDYELFEVSLVDSPANPLANIISIQKADEGLKLTGIAVEAGYEEKHYDADSLEGRVQRIRSAFYDEARMSDSEWIVDVYEGYVVVQSGETLYRVDYTEDDSGITFGERSEVEMTVTVTEKAERQEESVITTFVTKVIELLENKIGGHDMSDTNKEVVEKDATPVEEATDEVKAEEVSEVEEVEETEKAADDDKLVDSIVEKVLEKVEERLSKSVEEPTDEVVTKEAEEATPATDKEESEVVAALKALTETMTNLSKDVEALKAGTATRKSADVEGDEAEEDEVSKFWGNAFSGGFISADSL